MIVLALLNAFACGGNVMLTIWNIRERNAVWAAVCGAGSVLSATIAIAAGF